MREREGTEEEKEIVKKWGLQRIKRKKEREREKEIIRSCVSKTCLKR